MLIGFRNRLVVLVNWAWNYVTYDRGLRAIIGTRAAPALGEGAGDATLGSASRARECGGIAGGGFEPPTSRL